jgi:hypothetical protein
MFKIPSVTFQVMSLPSLSILIPSKSNVAGLTSTVFNLLGNASSPKSLEIIVVIDATEPLILAYRHLTDSLFDIGVNIKLLYSPVSGYQAIPAMYEQAFQNSTGALIFLYNDDAKIATAGWDQIYFKGLEPIPFGVASASCYEGIVTPGGEPGRYTWAFPMIRRDLTVAIGGKLCLGAEHYNFDRILDAYARKTGHTVQVPVSIQHDRALLALGSERAKHYAYAEAHWAEKMAQWDSAAQAMQDAVHQVEVSGQKIQWP